MNNQFDYDHMYKIIIIGNAGVGKTQMICTYMNKNKEINSTIGVDFETKKAEIKNKK